MYGGGEVIPVNATETAELVTTLMRMRDHGITVLIVEHDMGLVMEVSDEIVVLDRGFVVIGDVTDLGDKLRIVAARTIRRWGTTKGLGEIVAGPTSSTVHEALGDIEAPARAVIFTIKAERAGWARSF